MEAESLVAEAEGRGGQAVKRVGWWCKVTSVFEPFPSDQIDLQGRLQALGHTGRADCTPVPLAHNKTVDLGLVEDALAELQTVLLRRVQE